MRSANQADFIGSFAAGDCAITAVVRNGIVARNIVDISIVTLIVDRVVAAVDYDFDVVAAVDYGIVALPVHIDIVAGVFDCIVAAARIN